MIINQICRKPIEPKRKVPALKPPPPLEASVQESIVSYLKYLGYHVSIIKEHYSRNAARQGTGKFSTPGVPDLMCCKDGATFFLEVKRPKLGVMRDSQKKWHADYRAHGGQVWEVRSIEDVKKSIAELAVIEQKRRRVNNASSADDK